MDESYGGLVTDQTSQPSLSLDTYAPRRPVKYYCPANELTAVNFGLPVTLLAAVNVLVIIGNGMVICAVRTHRKLQTVTNVFVVSLAVSDLLLGAAVLPFSSANELLGYWPFGRTWCSSWLAVDVWLCTASIFNLCAISFDRYVAISRPIRYPLIMLPAKARYFVVGVWVLSFAIAIPPLLGWNGDLEGETEKRQSGEMLLKEQWTSSWINASNFADDPLCRKECPQSTVSKVDTNFPNLLTDSAKSSAGYVRNDASDGDSKEPASSDSCHVQPHCSLTSEPNYIIYSACGSFWIPMSVMVFFYARIYRTAINATKALRVGVVPTKKKKTVSRSTASSLTADGSLNLRIHRGGSEGCCNSSASNHCLDSTRMSYDRFDSPSSRVIDRFRRQTAIDVPRSSTPSLFDVRSSNFRRTASSDGGGISDTEGSCSELQDSSIVSRSPSIAGRRFQRNLQPVKGLNQIRNQLRRLNREKRAAKTVGIVVGCFILCWAPFFTVYLLGAFCVDCTSQTVFAVFFWLGYCNSVVNPFLYGLCSKDFRYAFRQLVCRTGGRRLSRQSTLIFRDV